MYDHDDAERSRAPAQDPNGRTGTQTADRLPSPRSTQTQGSTQSPGSAQTQGQSSMDEKAADVAGVAKEEMGTVAQEVRHQAGRVAADVRTQLGEQARARQSQVADRLRGAGDDLRAMAADRPDSPARTIVEQLADRSSQAADYLADRGPDGLLADVQRFARRQPAAFLVTAAAAGFIIGRLGKGLLAEQSETSADRSTVDTHGPAATLTYPATPGYDAPPPPATGVASAPSTTPAPVTTPAPATPAPSTTTYATGHAEPVASSTATGYAPVPDPAADPGQGGGLR